MTRTTIVRTIEAPVDIVFDTVADIRKFSEAIPHIVEVEFLTEQQVGVGTRFRETRLMRGKKAATELEVTEYVANDRVRIVADSHGTIWDSLFTVTPVGEATQLTFVMDARAQKLLPKLLNPLMRGFIAKAIEGDMDAVKAYCEVQAGA